MRKYPIVLLVLLACLKPHQSHAQTLKDTLQNIQASVAGLRDSVRATRDSLQKVSASILTGTLPVDSGALELAKAHPEREIYQYIITRKTATTLNKLRFANALALILVFWIFGIWLSDKNALLRDPSFDGQGVMRPVPKRPFSFSRVQLFWWTMIIISCYTYLFGITGVLAPINATTAILLGCGVLVYAAGTLIDNRQINKLPPGQRNQDGDATCEGFFTDILSDDGGISIHRFQAAVFNIVFGVAFVSFFISAVHNHLYPFIDFSEGQFALIGISSAAYLGLKATENKTPQVAKDPTPAGGGDCPPDTVHDEGATDGSDQAAG